MQPPPPYIPILGGKLLRSIVSRLTYPLLHLATFTIYSLIDFSLATLQQHSKQICFLRFPEFYHETREFLEYTYERVSHLESKHCRVQKRLAPPLFNLPTSTSLKILM